MRKLPTASLSILLGTWLVTALAAYTYFIEGQTQVQFLQAESASVTPVEEGVAILVEGLKPEVGYGVLLDQLPGVKWIEVHDVQKPFPPTVQEPFREGQFLIRGKPGQRFYVSQRGDSLPVWIEVEIESQGPPPPPPPPPIDFAAITEISKTRSTILNDPQTASELKVALNTTLGRLEDLCNRGLCPNRTEAGQVIVAQIEQVLRVRRTPNKDWLEGWRKYISQAIIEIGEVDTPTYLQIMRAAALGL